MSQDIFPKYISNVPEGIDELKGQAHDKIAEEIGNVIDNQNYNIQRQVIGLEGDWGSGKSNIIKKLENNLNHEKYLHFIFDTWGHQEDLNRRAILEELIDFLGEKEKDLVDLEWNNRKKQLSGKTINSQKNTFPEIKLFWILFLSSFIIFSFLKELYPFVEQINFYRDYSNPILKKLFFLFYIPYILFILGLSEFHNEYFEIKNNPDNKNLDFKNIIGRLFSIIQGKEIKTQTIDFVIESEPSNKNFRNFLDFINKKLMENEKTLILTIDNIDRLTNDKIKILWSTINIFFADKNDTKHYNNIWLIVPYDESKILSAFVENEKTNHDIGVGLIDKTFSVKFRVTPPIPSNWEILFDDKLKIAFGTKIIHFEEIDYIKRIFDAYTKEIITPRQIINFINDLVTIYSINKEIKFKYLSLFILAKKEIVAKPISQILSGDYLLENIKMIFNEDTELQKNISAITFGVSGEMAEEIVYSKEIRNILNSGNEVGLEKFKNNPIAFSNNFFIEFQKLNFDNLSLYSYEKIPVILNKIKELALIDDFQLNDTYWRNLKRTVLKMEASNPNNLKLNSFHKELCYYNIEFGKEILEKSIENIFNQIGDSKMEREFINRLKEIAEFLILKTSITVSDLKFNSVSKSIRVLEPENIIYLVKMFPDDFYNFELKFSETKLIEYYLNDDRSLNIELLNEDIEEVKKIITNLKYEFIDLVKQLKIEINNISEQELDNLDKYIKSIKAISKDKPLKEISIPESIINNNINNYKKENEEIYNLLVCFSFLKIETIESYSSISNIFNLPNLVDVDELSNEIENFIGYGDLLKMIVEKEPKYPLIQKLLVEITNKADKGNSLTSSWVLENFESISNLVFGNDEKMISIFYKKFNGWAKHIEIYLSKSLKSIEKIDLSIIDYAIKIEIELSKTLLLYSNGYLNSLTEIEIVSIIENKDTFENNLFKKLNSKNKVDDNFLINKLQPQLIIYLEDFARGNSIIQTSNSQNINVLFSKIEPLKQKEFYKQIISKLNQNEKLDNNQVTFFISKIIEEGLLPKTNALFLKHFINSTRFNYYFTISKMYKKIIDIVSLTKDNGLKTLIWDKVKKQHSNNEQKIYAVKKGLKPK